jgi:hypothetical protein
MTIEHVDRPPLQPPLAELERELIHAYLAGAGHDPQALLAENDNAARRLLADAALYASAKLTEIESRLHYVRTLQGEP